MEAQAVIMMVLFLLLIWGGLLLAIYNFYLNPDGADDDDIYLEHPELRDM